MGVCLCACVSFITLCHQNYLAETSHSFQAHELFTKEKVYPPFSFSQPPVQSLSHTHLCAHQHTHTSPTMYNYIKVTGMELRTSVEEKKHTHKHTHVSLLKRTQFSIIKVHCVIISCLRLLSPCRIIYLNTFIGEV